MQTSFCNLYTISKRRLEDRRNIASTEKNAKVSSILPHIICVHTWCNKFTEHTRLAFNMLRLMVMEDKSGDNLTKVKCPKTNGFRKSVGTSEWIVLQSLLAETELQPTWANRVKALGKRHRRQDGYLRGDAAATEQLTTFRRRLSSLTSSGSP